MVPTKSKHNFAAKRNKEISTRADVGEDKDSRMKRRINPFFAGLAMGMANLIPGVSGGTIAVILGIYDQLIAAINGFFSQASARKAHFLYLLPIGAGAITAIAIGAGGISYVMANFPLPTAFFFMGLIAGSIPIIWATHSNMSASASKLIAFILPFALMVWLTINQAHTGIGLDVVSNFDFSISEYAYLGLSGFIAAATMIIPGISGSLILLIMGSYPIIIAAIKSGHIPTLSAVMIGAALGIFLVSKGINWALSKYPGISYYAITGLLIGSLIRLYPGTPEGLNAAICFATLFIGVGIAKKLS